MSGFALNVRTLGIPEAAAFAAVLAVTVFVIVLSVRSGSRAARLVPALRAGALLLVAAVFLQPVWERRVRPEKVEVVAVMDRSESMAVADAGAGRSRWEAALAALRRDAPGWEKRFDARFYLLDQSAKPAAFEEIAKAAPRGAASNLAAMDDLPRRHPDAKAVVLFSDGRYGGKDPVPPAARWGVPVFAVGAGTPERSPDLAVASVRAPHIAFKNTDVEVAVRLEKRWLEAGTAAVKITREGEVVASQTVSFSTAEAQEVTLSFRPGFIGEAVYQVRAPVYDAETNRKNNTAAFSLNVVRDKVRVLYISGQPGPNYGFLRHQLKSNPSVELVSFVILRDPEDAVSIPDQQLALIPFPTQDVLLSQLRSFDVIILEQFSFTNFGIGPAGMVALREYVEKGGGLLIAGNSRVLGPDGPYRHTAIEDVLPLGLAEPPRRGPQKFALDVYGEDHPVMSLGEDGDASARSLWNSLPALEGNGLFPARTKPGAAVLAGARAADGGGALPVLAAWPRGKGRVMMFFNLTSWRWALQESGRGRGTSAYQMFWNNSLRWLAAADQFKLVRLDLPREAAELGEPVLLRAHVRDENHRPAADAAVQASLEDPAGNKRQITLKAVGKGEYVELVNAEDAGAYRVRVTAFGDRKKIGEDQGTFRAGRLWEENRDTSPDFTTLQRLAESTGGEFVPLERFSFEWLEEKVRASAWTYERRQAVWNSPWLLAFLTVCLLAEWFLRRRRGGA